MVLLQVKMNRMRQRIAQRLKEAQDTCAMLTTFNEVDMRFVPVKANQPIPDYTVTGSLKCVFNTLQVKGWCSPTQLCY